LLSYEGFVDFESHDVFLSVILCVKRFAQDLSWAFGSDQL
jgi:hypothetical protein